MPASFPSSVKAFTTKADGPGNTILAAYVNDLQAEVAAIENCLLGNTAFSAVVGGTLTLTGALIGNDTTDSTSITTGAFQTDGGLGVAKALWVGGLANIAGAVTLQSTVTLTANPATYGVIGDGTNGLGLAATNASGQVRFYSGGTTRRLMITSDGQIVIGTMSANGAASAINMTNTSGVGTPTGGGILYVESGALRFRGSSGTITTVAVA